MKKTIEKIKIILTVAVAGSVVALLLGAFMLAAITPEKDKNGNYTQAIKYWTDSAYYCNNFATTADFCKKN